MGKLYLVGTPIGNLEDISPRAIRTLREVTWIAAEDTRHTRKLLTHFQIHSELVSYHEHNKQRIGPELVRRLQGQESGALVTDAGMPAISDPGEDLVRLAIAEGIQVEAIPGPTALVHALVVSGLPTARFVFEGFLPTKKKERQVRLQQLRTEPRTFILYEAPHRLLQTLEDLADVLGDRSLAVARELTKLHEDVIRGTPTELVRHFQSHSPRGEFVIVGAGADEQGETAQPAADSTTLVLAYNRLLNDGLERKEAMRAVAERFGLSKRDVYQAVLEAKEETE